MCVDALACALVARFSCCCVVLIAPVVCVCVYGRQLISKMVPPCVEPITPASPYWAIFMGFEHERIHFETSSVLIRFARPCESLWSWIGPVCTCRRPVCVSPRGAQTAASVGGAAGARLADGADAGANTRGCTQK